jgi:hypothetical protein
MLTRAATAVLLAATLVGATARFGHAQVFLSSEPHPAFTVAPLFVSTSVDKAGTPPRLNLFWSLSLPPTPRSSHPSHLLLLLPFGIAEPGPALPGAPDVAAYVQKRGLTVERQGAIPIVARNRTEMGSGRPARPIGAAPFVTFVRDSAGRGRSRPASLVRIPWSEHLASPDWLVGLDMIAADLIRNKPASWYEDVFWGPRHIVAVSVGDLRNSALYPLYFELRDHVVSIGRDFSMLSINFADADHLRIDQLTPPSANRQPSESRRNTETVSIPIAGGEGITPQVVRASYGYYSGRFEWRPIVISLLFLIVGNITGPVLVPLVKRLLRTLSTRLHIGGGDPERLSGVVLPPDTIAKLRPGETTFDDVLRLCGPDYEDQQQQQLTGEVRRTLTYRGRRLVPQSTWRVGLLSHVRRWDLEIHEVEVELRNDRVADVQARIRRARWTPTEA